MCGIFGIVTDSENVPDRARLEASMRSLDHRGPDSQKCHAAPGAGFAHTRLSFVDVDARSDQPFWDVSGRYALIFNGEIYNYRQLRAELEAEGVVFRTTSDTEVLLKMLKYRDSEAAIAALEGMFAFALFDSHDRSLLMARDRFGMKPLFIQQVGEAFLFGSEVKAFASWTTPRVDRFMVASYLLAFRGPTSGFTFLDDVTSVSPGQIVVKRPGSAPQFRAFARLEDFLTPAAIDEYAALSSTQIVDHMEQLLSASVEAHLLADVPVGAFCSGGVDSSLLMGIAARRHNNLAIFHANVKGPFSEIGAAAALSRHLKLDLRSVDVEEREFIDLLPRAIRHFEQPLADRPNCVPMMQVACLARDSGVKGLLSGEGSDECFLGYPWLGRKALTDAYYAIGAKLRGGVRALPGVGDLLWPAPDGDIDVVRTLFNRREVAEDAERVAAAVAALSPVIEFQGHDKSEGHRWTLDYLHHHLRILLHRNDTMGMAGSIESRFPFLDHAVVRAAVNMPTQHKLRRDWRALDKSHPFTRDKWVVREVARRYMPAELSQRPKFGFWTNVFQRTRIDPRYFHGSWIAGLLGLTDAQMDHKLAAADPAFQQRLLHLDLWGRACVDVEAEDASVARLREFVNIKAL